MVYIDGICLTSAPQRVPERYKSPENLSGTAANVLPQTFFIQTFVVPSLFLLFSIIISSLPPRPSPSASAVHPPHCSAPSPPCGNVPDCPPCKSPAAPGFRPDGPVSRRTPHACSRTKHRCRKSPADVAFISFNLLF